jgi:hypothetical protein
MDSARIRSVDMTEQNNAGQEGRPEWPAPSKASGDKGGTKLCIWAKAGVVGNRPCTSNFKCDTCDFAASLMKKDAQALDDSAGALNKTLEKPGPERACRYTLSGHVAYKLCPNIYKCNQCSFNEYMESLIDAEAEKMAAKIKSLQEKKASKKAVGT